MANGANASLYSKKAEAGTRNNKKICTPDIPRCLYDSCDSGKLCGVQIGTVEVLFYNDHIFLCLGLKVYISDLLASQCMYVCAVHSPLTYI